MDKLKELTPTLDKFSETEVHSKNMICDGVPIKGFLEMCVGSILCFMGPIINFMQLPDPTDTAEKCYESMEIDIRTLQKASTFTSCLENVEEDDITPFLSLKPEIRSADNRTLHGTFSLPPPIVEAAKEAVEVYTHCIKTFYFNYTPGMELGYKRVLAYRDLPKTIYKSTIELKRRNQAFQNKQRRRKEREELYNSMRNININDSSEE